MGILSEVDNIQCIKWPAYSLNEHGSIPVIVQENLLLSSKFFPVDTKRLVFITYRWFCLVENIQWKLNLTAHLRLVPSQKMRGGTTLLHSNQQRYSLYRSSETI